MMLKKGKHFENTSSENWQCPAFYCYRKEWVNMKIRYKLFSFFKHKVFRIPEGGVLNIPIQIIRFILFPSHLLLLIRDKSAPFRYDWESDVFTIYGLKYSGDLFRNWGRHGLPVGSIYRIDKRKDDTLVITRLTPEIKMNKIGT